MARMSAQDRALFTDTELALIASSRPPKIDTLSPARVKAQMARARTYADKYRDLARRQHRAKKGAFGRGGPPGSANQRTERKEELLAEALQRFERRVAALERATRRRPGRRAMPSTGQARGAVTQRDTLRRKKQRRQDVTESSVSARAGLQFRNTRARAIQGHIRARGQRRQGQRDTR